MEQQTNNSQIQDLNNQEQQYKQVHINSVQPLPKYIEPKIEYKATTTIYHKNINRSFFHKHFCGIIKDIYYPVIVKAINSYFNEFMGLEQKYESEFNKLQNFRTFIKNKMKNLNYENVKKHISNLEYLKDVLNSLNENYIKMNSIKDPESIVKTSEKELFICVFTGTMRKIYENIFLFAQKEDELKTEKNKIKIYNLIKKGIKKSINVCMPLNFISADKNEIIKIMSEDGNIISIDKKKLLELYNNDKQYNYDNDDNDDNDDKNVEQKHEETLIVKNNPESGSNDDSDSDSDSDEEDHVRRKVL